MNDELEFDIEAMAGGVRRFLRDRVVPHVAQWEQAGEVPRELYREAAALGLLGLGYPEHLGGTPAPYAFRNALAVAMVDVRAVTGPITVKFADGSEKFTPLFETEVEHPETGEVVFSDDTGMLVARRWCWRQADQSAARDDTSEAIVTIEGHHAGARADVDKAIADLLALMGEYVGGEFTTAVLDKDRAGISG